MKIKLADYAGFCFGVERAVKGTKEFLKDKDKAYISGDLVHNASVVKELENLGLEKSSSIPESSSVVVRSHGERKEVKEKILEAGNDLLDCTCPVLLSIYKKTVEKYKDGYQIVIVGDREHPEIIAIDSYIDYTGHILNSKEEAKDFKNHKNLYVISQSTNMTEHFEEICDIIKRNNSNVICENTICRATEKRQEACKNLAQEVDLMVVIGGRNSSNTNKLYLLAKKYAPEAIKIESYRELDFIELFKYNNIGITAGASTPSWIIEEVINYMENYSKDELMEQIEDSMTKIYPKEIVKGEVIYVTDDEVIVNINYKSDGIVTLDELSNEEGVSPKELYSEGDEIEVYVIKLDDGEGNVVLSTRRVEGLKNWNKLLEAYENEETITVTVNKEVKGGLLGTAKGIITFIPGSQIKTYFVKDLQQFVGEELECRILSVDEKKRRLVASSRVIEEERKQKEIDEFWDTFEEDDVIKGTVARLVDFGAFVNLGPMDGLIHISDISWNRIKHPSEVFTEGEEIEVLVLKKDRERQRISLGYKQLTPKPFEQFLENNKDGDVVEGKVVNLVDFGAFIRLNEGVEGLVHVSEISHEHVDKPSDVLNIGDTVKVKILNIQPDEKRIALSLKALQEKPEVKKAPKKKPAKKSEKKPVEKPSKPVENNQGLDTSIGALLDFSLTEEDESEEE